MSDFKHQNPKKKPPSSGIQKAMILSHSLLGLMGLQRELGPSHDRLMDAASIAWASGLERRGLFRGYNCIGGRDIMHFALDGVTESFLYTSFEMDGYANIIQ